ncbi:MAG: Rv3235 family protein [Mycobacterium sp.]
MRPRTLAVMPVVDYEPPARAVPQGRLPGRPPSLVRPRCRHAPHPPSDRPAPVTLSPVLQAAATFADAALRRVLEVVDQRRPTAHLRPLLSAGLVDSVLSVHPTVSSMSGCANAATLQRVRLQVVGPDDPPTAAEVFGTYRRGRRIHAVACRIERVRAGTGPGWQVVALHIG